MNLLLGAICELNINQIKKWVESANEHFSGDIVILDYGSSDEVLSYLKQNNVNTLTVKHDHFGKSVDKWNPNTGFVDVYDSYKLVHNVRFFHAYQYLSENAGKYKYVFLTDVRDVYLQGDPNVWIDSNIGDKDLVFVSEGLEFDNEPWGKTTFLKNFGPYYYRDVSHKTIFNVGVVGGRAHAFRDFASLNFLLGIGHQVADQVGMNYLVHTHWFDKVLLSKSEDGLAMHAGTFLDSTKPDNIAKLNEPQPIIENGIVYTHDKKKYIFVHQYDRIPELNV